MKTKFLLIIPALALAGCANETPAQQAAAIADVTKLAAAVEPLVEDYAADGQINYAQAIPVALNSLAVFAPGSTVQTGTLASQIASTVAAFTNNTGASTGQKIAAALTTGLPAAISAAQAVQLLSAASVQASAGAQAVAGESYGMIDGQRLFLQSILLRGDPGYDRIHVRQLEPGEPLGDPRPEPENSIHPVNWTEL